MPRVWNKSNAMGDYEMVRESMQKLLTGEMIVTGICFGTPIIKFPQNTDYLPEHRSPLRLKRRAVHNEMPNIFLEPMVSAKLLPRTSQLPLLASDCINDSCIRQFQERFFPCVDLWEIKRDPCCTE